MQGEQNAHSADVVMRIRAALQRAARLRQQSHELIAKAMRLHEVTADVGQDAKTVLAAERQRIAPKRGFAATSPPRSAKRGL